MLAWRKALQPGGNAGESITGMKVGYPGDTLLYELPREQVSRFMSRSARCRRFRRDRPGPAPPVRALGVLIWRAKGAFTRNGRSKQFAQGVLVDGKRGTDPWPVRRVFQELIIPQAQRKAAAQAERA